MRNFIFIILFLASITAQAEDIESHLMDLYKKQIEKTISCADFDCFSEFIEVYGSKQTKTNLAKARLNKVSESTFKKIKDTAKYFKENIENNSNYRSTLERKGDSAILTFELKQQIDYKGAKINEHKKVISFVIENGEWKIGK